MTPAPRPTLGRRTLGCGALMLGGAIGLILVALGGRSVVAVRG